MSTEKEFNEQVIRWVQNWLSEATTRNPVLDGQAIGRLSVGSQQVLTGWCPWSDSSYSEEWTWKSFRRQLDVVVGIEAEVDGEPISIPILAIELKVNPGLNTDEMDKKSAIYGPLRELYPWIHTVFLHEGFGDRSPVHILRNTRQFETILTEWNTDTQQILGRIIDHQIDYLIRYWQF